VVEVVVEDPLLFPNLRPRGPLKERNDRLVQTYSYINKAREFK
jgi:hypothetical protein